MCVSLAREKMPLIDWFLSFAEWKLPHVLYTAVHGSACKYHHILLYTSMSQALHLEKNIRNIFRTPGGGFKLQASMESLIETKVATVVVAGLYP